MNNRGTKNRRFYLVVATAGLAFAAGAVGTYKLATSKQQNEQPVVAATIEKILTAGEATASTEVKPKAAAQKATVQNTEVKPDSQLTNSKPLTSTIPPPQIKLPEQKKQNREVLIAAVSTSDQKHVTKPMTIKAKPSILSKIDGRVSFLYKTKPVYEQENNRGHVELFDLNLSHKYNSQMTLGYYQSGVSVMVPTIAGDEAKEERELVIDDPSPYVNFSKLADLPGGVNLSGTLYVMPGVSKESQGKKLNGSMWPTISFSKKFLDRYTLVLNPSVIKYFYAETLDSEGQANTSYLLLGRLIGKASITDSLSATLQTRRYMYNQYQGAARYSYLNRLTLDLTVDKMDFTAGIENAGKQLDSDGSSSATLYSLYDEKQTKLLLGTGYSF